MLKIQYKAASIMTLFGVVIVLLLSWGYDILSHSIAIDKEMKNIKNIAEEVALHVESHLEEKARIAATLSSAPLIKAALLKSNSEFAALPDQKRKQEIDRRNQQWKKTTEINDPFIQAHMTNPLAEYLKHQQIIIPGEYGEIFLTNRYGVMIATTGKLTTLAHAHKYWWLACYDDGRGRIFLDDRGFDTSVQGYVLGVVVPIKDENGIIGILKCNVNIMGPLTDIVQKFGLRNPGMIQIVRTGGLIVSERGVTPLATRASGALVESLRRKVGGTTTIAENGENQLVAFFPIRITMGSKQIGFGGSEESIDHIKGNKGEGWHIVISLSEEKVIETVHGTTLIIITIGIIFTIITAFVALLLGKWAAKPIVELAATAKTIGEGRFDTITEALSKDEIGSLAKSLNRMATNLKDTMTSRDNLVSEVNQRKKTEEEKEKVIIELNKALSEIKTLRGILPLCSFCKKIRDDKGYWEQVDVYIHKHSQADISHGICPDCAKEHYPDLDIYDD
jgi:HAMP domain-containing protein